MAQYNLRLDEEKDRELIEHLREQMNVNQYLRDLIRADRANRAYTDVLIQRIREEWLRTGELEIENEELRKAVPKVSYWNAWYHGGVDFSYTCANCGGGHLKDKTAFCPQCGARMKNSVKEWKEEKDGTKD